ncbi:hypothetical protein AK830_g1661 [Neonectria ditissima]|uniref:Dienelactone hydrolase domain-containing protein n=1 Tax=Neonectria ditissima TaxID=78410 RepID=A0A0P7BTY8_9HYPO|nr:hypothetical protein AK830_g1661 [Neonectria ditissima]
MPDLFDGQKLDRGAVPPKSEDKKTQIQAFMAGPANFATNVEKIIRFRQDISLKWPSIEEHVGIFGLCWGGKVAILACGQGNEGQGRKLKASGTAHPGGLDPEDARKTNVPHLLLASPGESADKVAECKKILSSPGYTGEAITYHTMFHGFMGARANLEDEANRNEYERGYKQVAEFFLKHL